MHLGYSNDSNVLCDQQNVEPNRRFKSVIDVDSIVVGRGGYTGSCREMGLSGSTAYDVLSASRAGDSLR